MNPILWIGTTRSPWEAELAARWPTKRIMISTRRCVATLFLILAWRRVRGVRFVVCVSDASQWICTIPAAVLGMRVLWLGAGLANAAFRARYTALMLPLLNAIVVPNQSIESSYLRRIKNGKKIVLLYPPVAIAPQNDRAYASPLIVGCNAELGIADGLGMFLRGVALAQDILGAMRILIGGITNEKNAIEWLARELHLSQSLRIVPTHSHSWVQECDIYALPVRTGMPAPPALCWVFGSAGAIIASDTPAVREFIIQNKNGILIEERNADMLSQALINLARSPEWIRSIGTNNYRFAQQRFSQETFARRIAELLS